MNIVNDDYDDCSIYESWFTGVNETVDCTCDFVEILGQRYCGTSLPGPFIGCSFEVIFKSDYAKSSPGFRAVWTEIPDDREYCHPQIPQ